MTDDRTLLEMAAEAAGIDLVHSYYIPTAGAVLTAAGYGMRPWSPLTDDGDALRLAVKLRLDIVQFESGVRVDKVGIDDYYVPHDADPYAATRRAIVRAAAAMAGE